VDYLVPVEARKFSGGSLAAYDWSPFVPALTRAVARFEPVAVIAEYCWLAPVLDAVSNGALKTVDTHDLMHARPFIGDAWPRVRRARPAATLRVYGKVADVASASQADHGIEWVATCVGWTRPIEGRASAR
jgi:hypothetical protein